VSGAGTAAKPRRPGWQYELQPGVRAFTIRFAPVDAFAPDVTPGYEKARARSKARRKAEAR